MGGGATIVERPDQSGLGVEVAGQIGKLVIVGGDAGDDLARGFRDGEEDVVEADCACGFGGRGCDSRGEHYSGREVVRLFVSAPAFGFVCGGRIEVAGRRIVR